MAPTDPRILAIHKASWDFAQGWIGEEPIRAHARAKAAEIGCVAIDPGAGATLRVLAAAAKAHNVVEIGTGAGVSALWLLDGMNDDGLLTSIVSEAENYKATSKLRLHYYGAVACSLSIMHSGAKKLPIQLSAIQKPSQCAPQSNLSKTTMTTSAPCYQSATDYSSPLRANARIK